jgi:hypothetical protein
MYFPSTLALPISDSYPSSRSGALPYTVSQRGFQRPQGKGDALRLSEYGSVSVSADDS